MKVEDTLEDAVDLEKSKMELLSRLLSVIITF